MWVFRGRCPLCVCACEAIRSDTKHRQTVAVCWFGSVKCVGVEVWYTGSKVSWHIKVLNGIVENSFSFKDDIATHACFYYCMEIRELTAQSCFNDLPRASCSCWLLHSVKAATWDQILRRDILACSRSFCAVWRLRMRSSSFCLG